MSQRDAWATAQVPFFVSGPSGHVPVDPSVKARESAALAAKLAAFRDAGGKVEVLTDRTARTRRTAKA